MTMKVYDRKRQRFVTQTASAIPGTTDDLPEGASNLYFTSLRAIASALTGFVSGAGTVSATDSILQAIQKIVGNLAGKQDTLISGTNLKTVNNNTLLGSGDIVISGGDTLISGGALINSATEKTTPADTDMIGVMDSAASNVLKKISWLNLKETLQVYFSDYYASAYKPQKMYMGGGFNGSAAISEIDGFLFTEPLTAINPSATLATARMQLAGASSPYNGYFAGGVHGNGSTRYNNIDGIGFSTEAAKNLSATLSLARDSLTGAASTTVGYYFGGQTSTGAKADIDGIAFSAEAATNPAATIATARSYLTKAQSGTKAYIAGGFDSSSVRSSAIDAFTFATETNAALTATLAAARFNPVGVYSQLRAYFLGGDAGIGNLTEIDGVIFATDTAINPSATASATVGGGVGSQSASKGYISAYSGFAVLSFSFSTETSAIESFTTTNVGQASSRAGVQI